MARARPVTRGYTYHADAAHSSRRLLPSLFYCFKKKKAGGLERDHSKLHGRRGSGLLRLMSSLMKKKDHAECSQWNLDEEDNGVPVKYHHLCMGT